MKRTLAILSVVLAVVAPLGCLKVEVPTGAVNVGGNGETRDADTQDENGRTVPSQLPAGPSPGSWAELAAIMAGQVFLSAEQGAVFYAFDTLAYPEKPAELLADVISARSLKGVEGVTVAFRDAEGELLARATTGEDGRAGARWTPPEAGDYRLTAKIVAVGDDDDEDLLKVSPAPLVVSARKKDAKLAVIDLDHTVVGSSFFRVLTAG